MAAPGPAERRGDNGHASGANGLHALLPGESPGPWRRHVAPLLRTLEFDDHRRARWRHGRSCAISCQLRSAGPHFDKYVYSPWTGSDLHSQLPSAGVDTVVVTGDETDVCVLATVLGAVDWGFRVVLVTDAICGSADETHDSMMTIYMNPFEQQVECVTTGTLLASWPGATRASVQP